MVAQNVVLLLSTVLGAGSVLAQTPPEAAPESAQVADAFAELDALSATIAGRLQEIAQLPGLPAAPPLSVPTSPPLGPTSPPVYQGALAPSGGAVVDPPSPPSETDEAGGAGTPETEPEPCGTRKDMDLRIGEAEERFDGFRQIINAANDDLPAYREDVRDIDKVCTPQVEGNIASAINRLDRLEIEPIHDAAGELIACVDQRRRTIERELDQPNISPIRLQNLIAELERLTDTTHRVQDMEQTLLRADSKQRRLVAELKQFRQEIASACGT